MVVWCPEEDSNLHTLRYTDLNRARLPIPPSGPMSWGVNYRQRRGVSTMIPKIFRTFVTRLARRGSGAYLLPCRA